MPSQHRLSDILSVFVYGTYAILLGNIVFHIVVTHIAEHNLLALFLLALTPLFGYILADFVSGLVHFLGDTIGNEHTPFFGKRFIFPFREHHTDQTAITQHSFWYTNGLNCLVSLPIMIAMYHGWKITGTSSLWSQCIFLTLYFLVIGVFFTNQIHKWAHQNNPNAVIRTLQNSGLILTPSRHKLHHTAPFDSHFCITTGWLNPVLEYIGIFRLLRKR